MIRRMLPLFAALGLAWSAAAQAVPSEFVAADARWIAHVDVGGIFGSRLLGHVLASEGVEVNQQDLVEMASAYDLDPGRDIHSITVYGVDEDPETAVALVSGTTALQKAIDHLLVPMKRTELALDGVTLHRWSQRDGGDDSVYTYMASKADTDERLLIVGAQPAQVARALSVVRGERASLAANPGGMSAGAAPGTLVFAAVSEELLGQLEVDAPVEVTDMVRAVRVEFGETDVNTFLDARVTTAQPEQATQLMAMVEGGRAFLNLAAANEPDVKRVLPLLQRVKVERSGSELHLRFEHETDSLMALLHELSEGEIGGSAEVDFRVAPKGGDDKRPAGSSGWR